VNGGNTIGLLATPKASPQRDSGTCRFSSARTGLSGYSRGARLRKAFSVAHSRKSSDFYAYARKVVSLKSSQKMNTIIKLGMIVFALGGFSSLPANAGTADLSNSKSKKAQQRTTIAVSKSGVGVGQANQTVSKKENGVLVSTSFRHTRAPR
jgi:hypothetical protein